MEQANEIKATKFKMFQKNKFLICVLQWYDRGCLFQKWVLILKASTLSSSFTQTRGGGINWRKYGHQQRYERVGNNSILPDSIHLNKWFLISGMLNSTNVGSCLRVKHVAKAIANMPQSKPFCCCWTEAIVMLHGTPPSMQSTCCSTSLESMLL